MMSVLRPVGASRRSAEVTSFLTWKGTPSSSIPSSLAASSWNSSSCSTIDEHPLPHGLERRRHAEADVGEAHVAQALLAEGRAGAMPDQLMGVAGHDGFAVAPHEQEAVGHLYAVDLALVLLPRVAVRPVVVDEGTNACLHEGHDVAGPGVAEALTARKNTFQARSVVHAHVRGPPRLDREDLQFVCHRCGARVDDGVIAVRSTRAVAVDVGLEEEPEDARAPPVHEIRNVLLVRAPAALGQCVAEGNLLRADGARTRLRHVRREPHRPDVRRHLLKLAAAVLGDADLVAVDAPLCQPVAEEAGELLEREARSDVVPSRLRAGVASLPDPLGSRDLDRPGFPPMPHGRLQIGDTAPSSSCACRIRYGSSPRLFACVSYALTHMRCCGVTSRSTCSERTAYIGPS